MSLCFVLQIQIQAALSSCTGPAADPDLRLGAGWGGAVRLLEAKMLWSDRPWEASGPPAEGAWQARGTLSQW